VALYYDQTLFNQPSNSAWLAITERGRTIAVIGTPLSQTYPRENAELQRTFRPPIHEGRRRSSRKT
jgi:hypothetical protein